MYSSHFRFTLDLQKTQSQVSVPVTRGDTARSWLISFRDGAAPYALPDGTLAKLEIKRPTGTHIEEFCPIENRSAVRYSFSQNTNTAAVEGIHECAVILFDGEGNIIGSPRFMMIVSDRVVSSDDINLSDEDKLIVESMVTEEASRQRAEAERINAESARIAAEAQRTQDEAARQTADTERALAEESRAKGFETLQKEINTAAASLVSPTVTVTPTENGNRITVTDQKGEHAFSILNGTKGEQGPRGLQGPQGPQGIQGVQGKPFAIEKTFSSVSEMNDGFATDGVSEGGFVIIASGVETEDNAKLFVKGKNAYTFVTDLSGAQGLQGPQGEQGPQGLQGIPGKSAYQYAQEMGYTGTEAAFADDTNPDTMKAQMNAHIAEELAKKGQVKPEFFPSLYELEANGDTTKLYVLADGYIYAHIGGIWTNTGIYFSSTDTLEKVIAAACDKEVIPRKNYNLLKLSEVSYATRLQDDVAGTVSSNGSNAVTGWIPVQYGKYYTPSILYDGTRKSALSNVNFIRRMNVKLSDGSIIVYNETDNDYLIARQKNETIKILHETAVEMMLQIFIGASADISDIEKLEAYKPMIVEVNTEEESYSQALSLEYLNGDTAVADEVKYTLKKDTEIYNTLEKVIVGCCDKMVARGNYNLFKPSEALLSSRLQDNEEGITASTSGNIVTGWIPVEYGKYYAPSVSENNVRTAGWSSGNLLITRMNLRLSDGSIAVYGASDYTWFTTKEKTHHRVIKIPLKDAVAMRVQLAFNGSNVSDTAKLRAFKPMIVEGSTVAEAYGKSIDSEYLDGDLEVSDEISYTPKQNGENASKSPYYRDVDFGILPFSYYRGVADSYENSTFGWTTQYADLMAMLKNVIANHSGYVTETALGAASDGQTVYLYDFNPVRPSNQQKNIPKIIIIAGQHGGETANIFGLYYFVNHLLNKWNLHPALEYLRNHVELMIVPVLNPYGFDNRSYKNVNGVNLNRNYASGWEAVQDVTSSQYGGAEPFDQPETQMVRDLLLSNRDALLVIDFHVNGGGVVSAYSDINYYGVCESNDVYFNRMIDAVTHNLSAISANFNLDYQLGQPDTLMGHLQHKDGIGILRNWAKDQNFASVLVEGFGGFPNRTAFTPEVFKANEEIIVNWLITALHYLAK